MFCTVVKQEIQLNRTTAFMCKNRVGNWVVTMSLLPADFEPPFSVLPTSASLTSLVGAGICN